MGESSGYESLKIKTEESADDSTNNLVPVWQISNTFLTNVAASKYVNGHCSDTKEQLSNPGTAGPFLTSLLEKLKNLLSNTLYLNLHLTGLISRLGVYSQPLLRTYLLDSSLVLQPNVPSLIQVRFLIGRFVNTIWTCKSTVIFTKVYNA